MRNFIIKNIKKKRDIKKGNNNDFRFFISNTATTHTHVRRNIKKRYYIKIFKCVTTLVIFNGGVNMCY